MKDLDYRIEDKEVLHNNFWIISEEITENENAIATNTSDIAANTSDVATKATITRGTGAPSGGSDKDLYIDDTGGSEKLYVNVNGTWKYTALT